MCVAVGCSLPRRGGCDARLDAPSGDMHAHSHDRAQKNSLCEPLVHFNKTGCKLSLGCSELLKSVPDVERADWERLLIKRNSSMLIKIISSQNPRFLRPGAIVIIGCSPCFRGRGACARDNLARLLPPAGEK
jgi:hypothetical protein